MLKEGEIFSGIGIHRASRRHLGTFNRRLVEADRLLEDVVDGQLDAVLLQRHFHADKSGIQDEKKDTGK